MLGGIIGGALAGGIGGAFAGYGAYSGARNVANAIGGASSSIAASNHEIAQANLEIAKSVGKLNNTFDDEFNSREKRIIDVSLVNEDEEPIKFSTFFNQPPVFKERIRDSFLGETKREMHKGCGDWESYEREELHEYIQSQPNVARVLDCIKNQARMINFDFMPMRVYEDFFGDSLPMSTPTTPDIVCHKGFNVIYANFSKDDFVDKIKKYYEDELKKARKYENNVSKGMRYTGTPIWEAQAIIDNWKPSEKSKEIYKKLDELLDVNRQEMQEILMCDQEKYIRRTIRNYLKPNATYELTDLDYDGEFASVLVKNETEEAYLMIRQAPNVNVASKESF